MRYRRPFTGARIETTSTSQSTATALKSPLHGGADRNAIGRDLTGNLPPSPLHGGADRNASALLVHPATKRRPFTGARIETRRLQNPFPTSARRPFTGARIETAACRRRWHRWCVAPSRGRGSKRVLPKSLGQPVHRRPFTGARIETRSASPARSRAACRPFTGARIETSRRRRYRVPPTSPLHGGADRNSFHATSRQSSEVAPSRGRGSKRSLSRSYVDALSSRPFTGARIETCRSLVRRAGHRVAPSRGRGSKRQV